MAAPVAEGKFVETGGTSTAAGTSSQGATVAPIAQHTFSVYKAGPPFTTDQLRFNVALPQNFEAEKRATGAKEHAPSGQHKISDDPLALITCDAAIFSFNGPRDAGLCMHFVKGFMTNIQGRKYTTDFRPAGVQGDGGERCDLMLSKYPNPRPASAVYQEDMCAHAKASRPDPDLAPVSQDQAAAYMLLE